MYSLSRSKRPSGNLHSNRTFSPRMTSSVCEGDRSTEEAMEVKPAKKKTCCDCYFDTFGVIATFADNYLGNYWASIIIAH